MTAQQLSILLVCAMLATAPGCQVLGIPSCRVDGGDGRVVYDDFYEGPRNDGLDGSLPRPLPPLPPLPGWLGRWKKQSDLPVPPPYPRFHPLPTRPMFSPVENPTGLAEYGTLPASDAW